mgnify:CR=1 FL=1
MQYKSKSKQITNNSYNRPDKTFQETLSNQDIKEKLKEYKKTSNIKLVSIGTHIRYFSINQKTNDKIFRLGGTLNKVNDNFNYVILSNGSITWSVQISNAIFFQKMTDSELKEELKKNLKEELKQEMRRL